MIPTISLGPWDAPSYEILPKDMNPIMALFIENFSVTDSQIYNSLYQFLTLDTIYLRDESEAFFLKLEAICNRIVSDEFVKCNLEIVKISGFGNYLKGGLGDGVITRDVKAAAQGFLDFLASNQEYWPLRRREPGVKDSTV